MTDQEKLLSILPALAKLNSFARLPFEQQLGMYSAVPWIYSWKRGAIAAAIRLAMASHRIIAVERSCKACKGTGTYEWHDWNDEDHVEYERCRRCGATGKVILRFVESTLSSGWRAHTPRPKWDLGIFTEAEFEAAQPGDTDWTPEQPGQPLERLEFIRMINQVESVVYENGIKRGYGSYAESFGLHLGELAGCWICGSINVRYVWGISRSQIGLQWQAGMCDRCQESAAWKDIAPSWPVNLHRLRDESPEDRAPLPPLASDPAVLEWLARRQIYAGMYPPQDLAYAPGALMVRVKSATPAAYVVEVLDRWGHNGTYNGEICREYIGPLNDAELVLARDSLRSTARDPYVPQFDWSEVRV